MTSDNSYLIKYEKTVINNINRENFNRIIAFLLKEKCNYVEDIIEDYLDLFTLDYKEFIKRYEILNKKYEGKLIKKANEDMNILEEFWCSNTETE